LRLAAAVVAGTMVAALLAALVIGPKRLLARSGFAAADSRLVTGLLVTGTADRPILYVTSSDPRIGGDEDARDLDLDTNSGMISRLTSEGGEWTRVDLVRGLPRSEENHATNGLALDAERRILYVAQGGMTNQGAPSNHFAFTPEYALSGAILAVDLDRIGDSTYDLPTLDDETRPGNPDPNDPFGGNDGRNQAVLAPGAAVRLHARGFRNPYDVVLTRSGGLYTIDNGAAVEWGGRPVSCANDPREGGSYDRDTLHLITGSDYFGGHANPTRGATNPIECEYVPAVDRPALASFQTSTNGLAEYTGSNFGAALDGDLLAVSFDQSLYRVVLGKRGDTVVRTDVLHRFAGTPLDVTTQGDSDPFPGTIWVADYSTGEVTVLEPSDFDAARRWQELQPTGEERQEVSFVELDGKLYLAGGQRRTHAVYDPMRDTWSRAADLPETLDHVQAVALEGRIYYVGGLLEFPEPAAASVHVYDPVADAFSSGTPMPRPRGAGGVAAHEGLVYYAGGLSDGSAVRWFDVYDPRTRRWSRLPDMPRARDHFQAAIVDSRLYAIGGRDTEVGDTIAETDVYDFATGSWSTTRSLLPTPRGGYGAAVLDGEIWVVGGEDPQQAFSTVEVYDPARDSWRVSDPVPTPRHGIQAAVCGGALYVAAGGAAPYGTTPVDVLEAYAAAGPGCGRTGGQPARVPGAVEFRASVLQGPALASPTSLEFGPDGRLYVSQQFGAIRVLTVRRNRDGGYEVTDAQTIDAVRRIPNHNDDGTAASDWRGLLRAVRTRLGL
jgi:N-acetylneuraminic acid mutarotase